MKLVVLEITIVAVAMRAVLSLIGRTPDWPDSLWSVVAMLALASMAVLLVQELHQRVLRSRARRVVSPPHIPLERIGPYRHDLILARFGNAARHDIHLN